jgi:hypothetical protein
MGHAQIDRGVDSRMSGNLGPVRLDENWDEDSAVLTNAVAQQLHLSTAMDARMGSVAFEVRYRDIFELREEPFI